MKNAKRYSKESDMQDIDVTVSKFQIQLASSILLIALCIVKFGKKRKLFLR